jgi:hypothetical protein
MAAISNLENGFISMISAAKYLTQEQLKKAKNVLLLDKKFNETSYSFAYLWRIYNQDPPEPPYDCYFESQDEAINFAEKVMEKYNIACEIDPVESRKWKLVSKQY